MELRHLRYFVAVAGERSMSRAAERLRLTQPSLSRQLRQLEREVGITLFERTPTGTTLTPAGVALHRHALLLLRLADASRDAAHSAAERTREAVDIGIPPGLAAEWILDLLADLRTETPHASVTLTEASSTDQLRMVREGRLDVGLIHERPQPMLRGKKLFDQPFGIAVRAGHPLAGRGTCRVRDLDNLRILAHGREQVPVAHDRLIVAAHDAGAVPLWRFAQFSEHALACAEATEADAVLLTEHSANRLLPGWPWLSLTDPPLELTSWVVWQPTTRAVVEQVAELISQRAEHRSEE
ncbi:LysR family transcriptional regulator [Saccharopolyspora sp. K220]|uniref:LysR family transcriptional regulator n=1 Tax=Saccharopolyspora soli TaxID=2926618 RepID=UPI001F57BFAE|nr:LysR family transcriptional regulator [Saccharopolyspora soli]MCI2422419.1 LysR family transcriptional regulator [Saccharopolyspora soli]